jgi:flavin-dependent dehydrogenase
LEKYDAIVVGAGTAGCLAAKTMAEKGLKVCIVEKKKREEIGEKICGDALGEHHLKFLGLRETNRRRVGSQNRRNKNLLTRRKHHLHNSRQRLCRLSF